MAAPQRNQKSVSAPPVAHRTWGRLLNGMAKKSKCLAGHPHPSKSEAEYCNWLLARKQSGEIVDYKWQMPIPLVVGGKTIRYWAIDFVVYRPDGTEEYHESKGWNRSDDNFKLKRDLFLTLYPNLELYVNKKLVTYKPSTNVATWENRIKRKKELRKNWRQSRP